MKILVLDDDDGLLEAIGKFLRLHKHEVDTANNSKVALKMVEAKPYDFILVDYKMPGNDGIWFMKNTKLPRKTKVLLITAYVDRKVIKRMFELGACGYLIKPFDDEELLRNLSFFSKSANPGRGQRP